MGKEACDKLRQAAREGEAKRRADLRQQQEQAVRQGASLSRTANSRPRGVTPGAVSFAPERTAKR